MRLGDPVGGVEALELRAAHRGEELHQHPLGITHQGLRCGHGPGGVQAFDVHLHESLALGVEQRRVLIGGVGGAELGADGQHEVSGGHHGVGGVEAEVAEHAERQRMRLGEHAFSRSRGGHGDTEQLGQLTQLGLCVAHAHAVPRDDHRLLGLVEQLPGRW